MEKRGNKGLARGGLLPLAMLAIGVVLVIETVSDGGGPLSFGVILGVLFALAGAGRFYVGRANR